MTDRRPNRRLEPPPLYRAFMLAFIAFLTLFILASRALEPHNYPAGDPRNSTVFWLIVGGAFMTLIVLAVAEALRLLIRQGRK